GNIGGNMGPRELSAWTEEVRDIGATMRATSACGLGMAAPFVTDSLLKFFPGAVERHLNPGTANK
ncbi:NADH-ubiquinone oxidoreductase-F iron-sulfur binding region domain-containing protein, partial [Enterococcus casseliflavus]|uniref:NADH-ubiquinone oxidoreductase-F iron-sulfur binding region domain-containing protein n=1 Tax=Enterococcus casseliflavus TaxID=37734 RepID=UPI003D1419F1